MKKSFDKATTMQSGLYIIVDGLKKLMMNKSKTAYTRVKSLDRVFDDVFGYAEFGTTIISATTSAQVGHIIDEFGFKPLLYLVGDSRTFSILNSMVSIVENIRKDGKFIKRCRTKNRLPSAEVQKRYNKNLDLYKRAIKRFKKVNGIKSPKNPNDVLKSFVKNGLDGDEQYSGNELFDIGFGRGLDSFGKRREDNSYLSSLMNYDPDYDDDDEDEDEYDDYADNDYMPAWMEELSKPQSKKKTQNKENKEIQFQMIQMQQNMEAITNAVNNLATLQQQQLKMQQQTPYIVPVQAQQPVTSIPVQQVPPQQQVTPYQSPVESGRDVQMIDAINQLSQKSMQTDQILNKLTDSIALINQNLSGGFPRQQQRVVQNRQSPVFGDMFDEMDKYDDPDQDDEDEDDIDYRSDSTRKKWNKIAPKMQWVQMMRSGVRDQDKLCKVLVRESNILMSQMPDEDKIYFKEELGNMIEYIKAVCSGNEQSYLDEFQRNRGKGQTIYTGSSIPGEKIDLPEFDDDGYEETGEAVSADEILSIAAERFIEEENPTTVKPPVSKPLATDDYNAAHSTL